MMVVLPARLLTITVNTKATMFDQFSRLIFLAIIRIVTLFGISQYNNIRGPSQNRPDKSGVGRVDRKPCHYSCIVKSAAYRRSTSCLVIRKPGRDMKATSASLDKLINMTRCEVLLPVQGLLNQNVSSSPRSDATEEKAAAFCCPDRPIILKGSPSQKMHHWKRGG
jgi:hypothetical protein